MYYWVMSETKNTAAENTGKTCFTCDAPVDVYSAYCAVCIAAQMREYGITDTCSECDCADPLAPRGLATECDCKCHIVRNEECI